MSSSMGRMTSPAYEMENNPVIFETTNQWLLIMINHHYYPFQTCLKPPISHGIIMGAWPCHKTQLLSQAPTRRLVCKCSRPLASGHGEPAPGMEIQWEVALPKMGVAPTKEVVELGLTLQEFEKLLCCFLAKSLLHLRSCCFYSLSCCILRNFNLVAWC